jgi:hypothetical protein
MSAYDEQCDNILGHRIEEFTDGTGRCVECCKAFSAAEIHMIRKYPGETVFVADTDRETIRR